VSMKNSSDTSWDGISDPAIFSTPLCHHGPLILYYFNVLHYNLKGSQRCHTAHECTRGLLTRNLLIVIKLRTHQNSKAGRILFFIMNDTFCNTSYSVLGIARGSV